LLILSRCKSSSQFFAIFLLQIKRNNKLIESYFPSFSTTFSYLFAIRFLSQLQSGAFFVTDIEIIVFKSFKPIRTRSNGYNIFTIRLTNNSVCISRLFFWYKQNKRQWRSALYLAPFLIVLYVRLCWHLWLVMHKCYAEIYKNHKRFCL